MERVGGVSLGMVISCEHCVTTGMYISWSASLSIHLCYIHSYIPPFRFLAAAISPAKGNTDVSPVANLNRQQRAWLASLLSLVPVFILYAPAPPVPVGTRRYKLMKFVNYRYELSKTFLKVGFMFKHIVL